MLKQMKQPIPEGTVIVPERARRLSSHGGHSLPDDVADDYNDDDDDDESFMEPNETVFLAIDGVRDEKNSTISSPPQMTQVFKSENESIDDDFEWPADDKKIAEPVPPPPRRSLKRSFELPAALKSSPEKKLNKVTPPPILPHKSNEHLQRIADTMEQHKNIMRSIESKFPDATVLQSIDRTLKNLFKIKVLEFSGKYNRSVDNVLEDLKKIEDF